MDLSTIRFVIWVLSRFVDTTEVIDLMGLFREFQRTTFEEIDYVAEAGNGARFREIFREKPELFVPRVCDGYVSRRVLVMEWVDGIKINDYAALEAAGVDRGEVARRTVEAYLYQFFEVGFFHADPHPGNIFVQPGTASGGPIITFVDFGMVGTLTKSMKQAFKNVFLGFLTGDAEAMANALQRLGFIGPGANMAAIQRGIALMLEQYRGMRLGELKELDFSAVASELEDLLYSQPFRIPVAFAFSGKAVGTLSGVATGLAPELNLIDIVAPYARRFLGLSGDTAGQSAQQVVSQLFDGGRTLLTLPGRLERVLSKIETGQIEIRLADGALDGRSGRRGRVRPGQSGAATELGGASWVLMFGLTLAGGIVLLLNQLLLPGWFCLGLAGLTLLLLSLRR
jgi:predicted unusual protein kinase regulating ubiquinone biosynthesis (AarF/ABC1/UbiB family)